MATHPCACAAPCPCLRCMCAPGTSVTAAASPGRSHSRPCPRANTGVESVTSGHAAGAPRLHMQYLFRNGAWLTTGQLGEPCYAEDSARAHFTVPCITPAAAPNPAPRLPQHPPQPAPPVPLHCACRSILSLPTLTRTTPAAAPHPVHTAPAPTSYPCPADHPAHQMS